MWQKIRGYLDEKLIRPFRESHAPVQELALGSAVGMFWAMTPLVGIQMYLVTMSWLGFKLLRWKMNLAVGLAMVWISNPITMGPLYYAFYKAGYITFDLLGLNPMVITFENFEGVLKTALAQESLIASLKTWGEFLLNDLGWPTMVGGLLMAIPSAIASYPVTKRLVNKHRSNLARKEGLSLEDWEAKHIHSFRDILKIENEEHQVEKHSMEAARHPEEYLAFARKKASRKSARSKSSSKKSGGKKSPNSRKSGSSKDSRKGTANRNASTSSSKSSGSKPKSKRSTGRPGRNPRTA